MRTLPLVALLAPALAFGQDKPAVNEAPALLKKVEERHATAKTVHVKSKITTDLGHDKVVFDCELWFGAGGRFKMVASGNMGGMEMKSLAVSDGKRLRTEGGMDGGPTKVQDLPKGLAEGLRVCVVRIGAMTAMIPIDKEKDKLAADGITAHDISFGADEKIGETAAKVLVLELRAKDEKEPLKAKIFVDAATLRVLRREMSSKEAEKFGEGSIDTTFDEELKDDFFAVQEAPANEEPKPTSPPTPPVKEEPKKDK